MHFSKLIVVCLLTCSHVWSQEEASIELKGHALWSKESETNQSIVRRELFHQAYLEMVDQAFKLLGKNGGEYWSEVGRKIAPILSLKKSELQKKYGLGTPKWDPSKEKELEDEFRHAELIELRQFGGLADSFKKIEIVSYAAQPTPKMEIKSQLDKAALLKIYDELMAPPIKAEWGKLFLEIQVDQVQNFSQKSWLIQEATKVLQAQWGGLFKEIVVVDDSLKAEISEFMREGAELTIKDAKGFSQASWLKLHFKVVGEQISSVASLIYLQTHQIVGNVEAPTESVADESKRPLFFQKKLPYLLTELKKTIKAEDLFQQITLVKIVDFTSLIEVYKKIDEIKAKGTPYQAVVEMRKVQDKAVEVLVKQPKKWVGLEADLGLLDGKLSAGAVKKEGP